MAKSDKKGKNKSDSPVMNEMQEKIGKIMDAQQTYESENTDETSEFDAVKPIALPEQSIAKSTSILAGDSTADGLRKKRKTKRQIKRRRRRRRTMLFGISVIIFSVVGLLFVSSLVINGISGLFDKQAMQDEIEKLIRPIVMYDPVDFESAESIEPIVLLQTSMWSTMMNNNKSRFETEGMMYSLIPASELDVQSARIYGPEVKLNHQTFRTNPTIEYDYDEQSKTYHVEDESGTNYYSPEILSMTENPDDTISVQVAYMPPDTMWVENKTPEKIKDYLLQKTASGYYVISLKSVRLDTIPSSDATIQ